MVMNPEISGREQQIMRLLAQGEKTTVIARALSISTKTVEAHYTRIKCKLGLVRGAGSQAVLVTECKKRFSGEELLPELNAQTFTEVVESLDGEGLKRESA